MRYTGICIFETYPWGFNESCVCTRPKGDEYTCPTTCLIDEANDFMYNNPGYSEEEQHDQTT